MLLVQFRGSPHLTHICLVFNLRATVLAVSSDENLMCDCFVKIVVIPCLGENVISTSDFSLGGVRHNSIFNW